MDAEKTIAIFRQWPDGEILVLFPDIRHSGDQCSSYMHTGQHGGADYVGCIAITKPVTMENEAALKLRKELSGIGYNLDIRKRWRA